MKLGNALGIPEDVFRYVPDKRLILPEDRVGVEFEFEGVHTTLDRVKEGWTGYYKSKPDRSLHDNGMEYVFSKPMFGADVVEAVTQLCRWAKANNFKVSIRTGLHVHVDIRDLTRNQLVVLNVLYALFERALYRICGNNREENVFCLPWYKADHMQSHVTNINSTTHDIREASEALENEKYGGLNLDTIARFGSVEFRMALATMDAEWVLNWINVCLSFKRAAKKLDVAPIELLHSLSGIGVENFARQVFEDLYDTIAYPAMDNDVWATGIETALNVLPKALAAFDKAALSWNKRLAVVAESKVNPRLQAFVAKHGVIRSASPYEDKPPNHAFMNVDFEARAFEAEIVDDAQPDNNEF